MSRTSAPTPRYRYRIAFRKAPALRFVSHLDLMRALERALRRAALPLALTQGFNPHPRLAFLLPTSVGMASDEDFVECELSEAVPANVVLERLRGQLPEGLDAVDVEPVPRLRATPVESVEYEAVPPPGRGVDTAGVEAALVQEHWLVVRPHEGQERQIDIRPYVLSARVEGHAVKMHLKVTSAGTARPAEVLLVLGISPEDALQWMISRKRVHLAQGSSTK